MSYSRLVSRQLDYVGKLQAVNSIQAYTNIDSKEKLGPESIKKGGLIVSHLKRQALILSPCRKKAISINLLDLQGLSPIMNT